LRTCDYMMTKSLWNCKLLSGLGKDTNATIKLFRKSSCLHPLFGPAFTRVPPFSGIYKVRNFLSNLSMKCWNSAFNAQGWRVTIIVVNVGVKIVVQVVVEACGSQETWTMGWNSIYHQNFHCSQLFRFVKFSFPVTPLMPYYAKTGHPHPLITWLYTDNSNVMKLCL